MRHQARIICLLASSLLPGACHAAQPPENTTASAVTIITEVPQAKAPGRGADAATGPAMTETRIFISSNRGRVTAELFDNDATRALVQMLPVTIEMRDHLQQEKTGTLPSPLPEMQRQTEFSAGTLGLWGNGNFVVYYRNGRVPSPGIILLGRVTGDLSIFESPGRVTVRIGRIN
jgi:hypothetical protein